MDLKKKPYRYWRTYFLISVFCLLASCAVGPNFALPEQAAAVTYNAGGDNLLSEEQRLVLGQSVQTQWWKLMESPPLDTVLQRAFTSNKDLAGLRASLTKADAMVKAQSGNLWPHLGVGAMASRQDLGDVHYNAYTFNIPAFSFYETGAYASFALDLFGGEKRKVEMREALAEYQRYRLDAAYLSLSGQVVGQAIAVADARAQVGALEGVLRDDDEIIRLAALALESGAITQIDMLKWQSMRDSDAALIPALLQREDVSSHTLSVLAGETPGNWTPPAFELNHFTLPRRLPISLPSELARHRPDIRAAEANLHAASAAIGAAEADLYPDITLNADVMLTMLSPSGALKAVQTAWALAAQIKMPIVEGGSLTAQEQAAEAAYQEALATYQQTVLQAFEQVADILRALQHDADESKKRQQILQKTKQSLTLIETAYRIGDANKMQVLESSRQHHQAEANLANITAARYVDTVMLFVALGGSREGLELPLREKQ